MRDQAMAEIDAALNGEDTSQPDENAPAEKLTPDLPTDQKHDEEEENIAPAPGAGLSFRSMLTGLQTRLGSLPQPTSILLPLVILLVAFFLLIPINGHTRFVWLWLTLTGNAAIGQGSGSGGQTPPPPSNVTPMTPNLAVTSLLPTYSHVEELG